MLHETVKIWIDELLEKHSATKIEDLPRGVFVAEIEEAKETIKNEHLWELGYNGEEPVNPHTENIEVLEEYIGVLEEQLEKAGSFEQTLANAAGKAEAHNKERDGKQALERNVEKEAE